MKLLDLLNLLKKPTLRDVTKANIKELTRMMSELSKLAKAKKTTIPLSTFKQATRWITGEIAEKSTQKQFRFFPFDCAMTLLNLGILLEHLSDSLEDEDNTPFASEEDIYTIFLTLINHPTSELKDLIRATHGLSILLKRKAIEYGYPNEINRIFNLIANNENLEIQACTETLEAVANFSEAGAGSTIDLDVIKKLYRLIILEQAKYPMRAESPHQQDLHNVSDALNTAARLATSGIKLEISEEIEGIFNFLLQNIQKITTMDLSIALLSISTLFKAKSISRINQTEVEQIFSHLAASTRKKPEDCLHALSAVISFFQAGARLNVPQKDIINILNFLAEHLTHAKRGAQIDQAVSSIKTLTEQGVIDASKEKHLTFLMQRGIPFTARNISTELARQAGMARTNPNLVVKPEDIDNFFNALLDVEQMLPIDVSNSLMAIAELLHHEPAIQVSKEMINRLFLKLLAQITSANLRDLTTTISALDLLSADKVQRLVISSQDLKSLLNAFEKNSTQENQQQYNVNNWPILKAILALLRLFGNNPEKSSPENKEKISALFSRIGAKEISLKLSDLAKLAEEKRNRPTDIDDIFNLLEMFFSTQHVLLPINTSNIFSTIVTLSKYYPKIQKNTDIIAKLFDTFLEKITEANAKDIYITLAALVRLRQLHPTATIPTSEHIKAFLEALVAPRAKSDTKELSNILFSLSNLSEFYKDIESNPCAQLNDSITYVFYTLARRIEEASSQDISISLLAIAKLTQHGIKLDINPQAIRDFFHQLASRIEKAKPQDIGMSLLAITKLTEHGITLAIAPNAIKDVFKPLADRIEDATSEDISSSLSAIATLTEQQETRLAITPVIDRVLTAVAGKINSVNSEDISLLLKAMDKLKKQGIMPSPNIIRIFFESFAHRIEKANPKDISTSLSVIAKLTEYGITLGIHPDVIRDVFKALAHRIKKANSQDISTSLWAIAKLTEHSIPLTIHPDAIRDVFEALARRIEKANSQDITTSLWAIAKLTEHGISLTIHTDAIKDVFEALAREINSAEPKNISNSLWASTRLALFNMIKKEELKNYTRPLLSKLINNSNENIDDMVFFQLAEHICYMYGDKIPADIQTWYTRQQKKISPSFPSSKAKSIIHDLNRINITGDTEKWMGWRYADFVVQIDDQEVIIEIDGPHHEDFNHRNVDQTQMKLTQAWHPNTLFVRLKLTEFEKLRTLNEKKRYFDEKYNDAKHAFEASDSRKRAHEPEHEREDYDSSKRLRL